MKRTQWIGCSVAVVSLLLSACGDDGPKTLSENDFVTAMNDVCRDATRSLRRLDPEDTNYYDDVLDVIQTGQDAFGELTPPKSIESDFDDYVNTLDDRYTQLEKYKQAVADGDQDAAMKIALQLDDIDKQQNDVADLIGADRCKDVGGGAAAATADTTPDETTPTTPNTPLPIETTAPTEPPVTQTADTEPSVTDAPVMTDPSTAPSGLGPFDASAVWAPPEGYEWGTLDLTETQIPADDPVLAPLLSGYYAGVVESAAGQSQVGIYVTALADGVTWTPEALNAYYTFELVGDGTDAITPTLGLPGKVQSDVIDGFDAAAVTFDGFGVAALGPTGTDLLALIDAFVQAQST